MSLCPVAQADAQAGPFAAPMNEIPKVVFSNSLTSRKATSRLLRLDRHELRFTNLTGDLGGGFQFQSDDA